MLPTYLAFGRPDLSPWAFARLTNGLPRLQSHRVSSSVSGHEKKRGNSHCNLEEKKVTHASQKKPKQNKLSNHLANTQEIKYFKKTQAEVCNKINF